MNLSPAPGWSVFDFDTLPSFSWRQAVAWNALRRAVAGEPAWQTWIEEGLAGFFESPAGFEIRLRQKHTMDPQQADSLFVSQSGELVLGRDETCDVRLVPRSVGNRHTRIFTRAGQCYIEDLGSALGTFLNESRLPANQPAPLVTGDQFAIFPYTFTVEVTERWVRDASVDVCAGAVLPLHRRDFRAPIPADQVRIQLQLRPVGAILLIETTRTFLEALSASLLAPLCPGLAGRPGLTPADTGFLELLLAAVLERINRDLRFPLQSALAPVDSLAVLPGAESGLAFSFAVRLAEMTGTFRLLMTDEAIELLARIATPQACATLPAVSWRFPLSAGYIDLTAEDAAVIEPLDVVLFERENAILFPRAPERGWRFTHPAGNLSRAIIDHYFERSCLDGRRSESQAATDLPATPDLTGLPLRLRAIIGEKEMTLAEASLLTTGTAVNLDIVKSDPVDVALNGKVVGVGELVEMDGQAGVRILSWRGSSPGSP